MPKTHAIAARNPSRARLTPLVAIVALTVLTTSAVSSGQVLFTSAASYGVGTNPTCVTVGDFNGDGKQDLATGNFMGNTDTILLGQGDGSFTVGASVASGTGPESVAVGDFNEDGQQDLATCNNGTSDVTILLGQGNGSFASAVSYAVGLLPHAVVVGDFDEDGNQDLATANLAGNSATIRLGLGDGTFASGVDYATGLSPRCAAVGDFNADGHQDLATGNFNSNSVTVLLGQGNGTFATGVPYAVGTNPRGVAVGDFDADGKQDLAVANLGSSNVTILSGQGNGTFTSGGTYGGVQSPFFVVVGDFNLDGKPDLAGVNQGSNSISILLGQGLGHGNFTSGGSYAIGGAPRAVVVGDFNGDGKQDLASADYGSSSVTILLNQGAGVPGWTHIGLGKLGGAGVPLLAGTGTLTAASPGALDLTSAKPSAPATLILGLTPLNAPFKGGTLVPNPSLLIGLTTSPGGAVHLPFVFPAGIPSGTALYFQFWVSDPAATVSLAASNGLKGVTP